MSDKSLEYMKNSNTAVKFSPLGTFAVGGLHVYVKEPVPEQIDIEYCFSYILEKMPKIFFRNIAKVFVGQFPFLKNREVDAIYKDGTIYITNNQETNESMIADIIHELAHAFEEEHKDGLYGDLSIENEFLSKRKALLNILKSNNLLPNNIEEKHFSQLEYNQDFDLFLYKTVGYQRLSNLTNNIFISPYAATCLREYFASAFEIFFTKDLFIVKKQAPSVYKKLINYLEI